VHDHCETLRKQKTDHYENRKQSFQPSMNEVLQQIYLYVYSVTILKYVDVQQNC